MVDAGVMQIVAVTDPTPIPPNTSAMTANPALMRSLSSRLRKWRVGMRVVVATSSRDMPAASRASRRRRPTVAAC